MVDVTNEIMTNDKTKILSGEFLNFYTPRRQRIRSFKVYFSPKQEGSGTPSPENVRPISGWTGVEAGHCGKNLIPDGNDTSFWRKGYINSSGNIITSNEYHCTIDPIRILPGTYTLSGLYSSTVKANYKGIYIYNDANEKLLFKETTARTLTFTVEQNAYLKIYMHNALIDSIQLEYGSTATEYAPYKTNLLLPKEYQQVEYLESKGTQYIVSDINVPYDENQYKVLLDSEVIELRSGSTNIICGCSDGGNGGTWFGVTTDGKLTVGGGNNFVISPYERVSSEIIFGSPTMVATIDNETVQRGRSGKTNDKIAFFATGSGQYSSIVKIYSAQIIQNDSLVTNFIPCYRISDKVAGMYDAVTGQFYTNSGTGEFTLGPAVNRYGIDWSEDVGTVYGGYVDLVSGELVEEWENLDLSSLSWNSSGNRSRYNYKDKYITPSYSKAPQAIAEKYNGVSVNNFVPETTFAMNGQFIFYYDGVNKPTGALCAKLATPITHQLSPTTLSTLMLDNNFWSNADRIEIEYDYIGIFDAITSRKNIFTATPHTVVEKDSIISFGTDMAADLKECKVHFTPIQEGEGDPSPDNVRPIHGWDGITVTRTGKNLFSGEQIWKLCTPNASINEDENGRYVNPGSVVNFINFPDGIFKEKTQYTFIMKTYASTEIVFYVVLYSDGVTRNITAPAGLATFAIVTAAGKTVKGIRPMNRSGTRRFYYEESGVFEGNLTTDAYEPYTETYLTIPFPQTIYGGYVDLVKGEVVEEWNNKLITGETIQNYAGNGYNGTQSTNRYLTFVPNSKQSYQSNTALSNYLTPKKVAIWTSDNYPNCFTVNGGYQLHVRFANDIVDINATNDTNDTKTNKIKEYLNENPLQLVYPLKSNDIMHYPIDPQILKALRGMNNIWSNANSDIEITYWKHNDDAYQHVPSSPITSNDNFIIVTDDGYAIGEEDDFIVY